MQTFHEASHRIGTAGLFLLLNDRDTALVVGDFFPQESLPTAKMEFLSESGWNGNLTSLGQSRKSGIHTRKASCRVIMAIFAPESEQTFETEIVQAPADAEMKFQCWSPSANQKFNDGCSCGELANPK